MKNSFKLSIFALAIAVSAAACTGHTSGSHPDTTEADPSVMTDSSKTGPTPGANGSAISADTGLDHSGSGGTDTTKMP